jgi:hypothetical protein
MGPDGSKASSARFIIPGNCPLITASLDEFANHQTVARYLRQMECDPSTLSGRD